MASELDTCIFVCSELVLMGLDMSAYTRSIIIHVGPDRPVIPGHVSTHLQVKRSQV